MTNKQFANVGFSAPILFWLTYFVMANQRPEYSFLTKAVSELGSVDAPNKWTWNVLGYILPGICVSVFAVGLYSNIVVNKAKRLPLVGLFLRGVFMSLSGVFPGDFDNKQTVTMLLHTIGSFGSFICFLITAFTYPKEMKQSSYWSVSIKPLYFLPGWQSFLVAGHLFFQVCRQ